MHLKFLACLFAFFPNQPLFSQGVLLGDEPGQAHSSAILDIRSDEKGLLIPSMTTAERDAIPEPFDGLLIYNITIGYLNIYDSVEDEWITLEPLTNIPPPPLPPPAILPGQNIVLNGAHFGPEVIDADNFTFVRSTNGAYFSEGFGRILAPVTLPVGSIIFNVTIYYYDNSPGSSMLISLVEQSLGTTNPSTYVSSYNTSVAGNAPMIRQASLNMEELVPINSSFAISAEVTDGWNIQLAVQAVIINYLLPTD